MQRLAKELDAGKFQLAGVRPGVVSRDLTYVELSNMLDAVIADIHKYIPDIFNGANTTAVKPPHLKMYLLSHAIWFFEMNGSLSMYTGGPAPISTSGFAIPRSLLSWLSHLAPYEEGGAQGVVAFAVTAMPTTGTTNAITVGSPVITDTSIGVYDLAYYKVDVSLFEWLRDQAAAASEDYPSFWQSRGKDISALLSSISYPTESMPAAGVKAPNGSAWAHPVNLSSGNLALSAAQCLGNVFTKWNVEEAMLFLDWSSNYHIGPAASQIPIPNPNGTYGFNGTTPQIVTDSARILRENYVFLARNTVQELGHPIMPMYWLGEKVDTLNIVPIPITRLARDFADARIIAAIAGTNPSGTNVTDSNWLWSYYYLVRAAEWRRIQVSNPRYEIQNANTQSNAPASITAEPARIPLLDAQFSSEIGCVVHHGQLHAPQVEALGQWWYNVIGGSPGNPHYFFYNGCPTIWASSNTFPINGATVLDGTWRTNYGASAGGPLWVPCAFINLFAEYFMNGMNQGTKYGGNELVWTVTNNPRGGASMLTRYLSTGSRTNNPVRYLNSTNNWGSMDPIVGLVAWSTIPPADLGIAALAGFSRIFGQNSTIVLKTLRNAKFSFAMPPAYSGYQWLEDAVSATVNTGGSATMLLAKAIEKRHSVGDSLSLMSGSDDVDACLWDALKGVFHNVARAVEPVVPFAAGAICSTAGGPAAAAACSATSRLLMQRVVDISGDKTNRQSYTRVQAQRALTKEGKMLSKPPADGDPVSYGPHLIDESLPDYERDFQRSQKKAVKKQVKAKLEKKVEKKVARKVEKKVQKKVAKLEKGGQPKRTTG